MFRKRGEKIKKRRQKAENVMIHHATQKRRSTDISHRRRFTQIKVLYRRCFFFERKNKKKKEKKRIEVIHGFRQTDKATSVGRPTAHMSDMFDIK